MKISKKTLSSISLALGFLAVVAGAWFMIKHIKGIIIVFIFGIAALIVYGWANSIGDGRKQ